MSSPPLSGPRRLIEGTYGLPIESGEPIPDERLEAVPPAERTAEEQARFERHVDSRKDRELPSMHGAIAGVFADVH